MRLYIDTMVWIYALESHPEFGIPAQEFLRKVRRGRHRTVTSHFLLAETLVLPVRKNDTFSIAMYKLALLHTDSVQTVSFDEVAAMTFAQLRATHRTKSPDSIHLALAAKAQVDAFITTDTRLHTLTVPGISLIGDLTTPLPDLFVIPSFLPTILFVIQSFCHSRRESASTQPRIRHARSHPKIQIRTCRQTPRPSQGPPHQRVPVLMILN
jgi:predicted nucleic acid-binding protein